MDRPMKNGLEWTVFALSLALVLATMGYLVSESLGGERAPRTSSSPWGPRCGWRADIWSPWRW